MGTMTARPPTWQDVIGHACALCAYEGDRILCRWCYSGKGLLVRTEGEPVPCAACGAKIVSVAEIEGRSR